MITVRTASGAAREDSAEAPADDADLTSRLAMDFAQACLHFRFEARAQNQVTAESPTVDVVAAIGQIGPQRLCRDVACDQARQHEHRVTVTRGAVRSNGSSANDAPNSLKARSSSNWTILEGGR